MDFLTGNVKPVFFKYLSAAFGSALVASIYAVVDMAVVGQYQGPSGTAALAVVAPIWNIIYGLGPLMGIGGSVLFSTLRGESADKQRESNEYFTAALIGGGILSVIIWSGVALFDRELLLLFGAEETLLPLNVFSTYYFQALMKPAASFLVSVGRGVAISGFLIYFLPAVAGADAIWFSMPLTELVIAVAVGVKMAQYTKQLPNSAVQPA